MRTVFTQRAPLIPWQGSARNVFDSWRWLNPEKPVPIEMSGGSAIVEMDTTPVIRTQTGFCYKPTDISLALAQLRGVGFGVGFDFGFGFGSF